MFQSKSESDRFCQKLFDSKTILSCEKQYYHVKARKLTADEMVSTEENRDPGQSARAGQWVITRLEADGTEQLADDGLVNRWVNDEKDFAKTYVVSPEVLAAGHGVVATKSGNVVYMVKLEEDLTIVTGWGTAAAKAGGYLVCYDYKVGTPGSDFNIVSATYFKRSYKVS